MQHANGNDYKFSYSYDAAGETCEEYPSGRVVNYTHDGAARISKVQSSGASTAYATVDTYAAHGAIGSMTLGNNSVEQSTFNSRLQVSGLTVTAPVAGSPNNPMSLLTLGYCYGTVSSGVCSEPNNNGNLRVQTISAPVSASTGWSVTQNYPSSAYDAVNRLTQATEVDSNSAQTWQDTYGYDPYGNRWLSARTGTGMPATNETPTSNLYQPASGPVTNRINGWTYDNAGNIQQVGSMDRHFTYDGENRLLTATINGAKTTYGYDGGGQRISKATPDGVTTYYIYNASGELAAEYGGTPAASGTQYLTVDNLGSTRLVTGPQTGSTVANYGVISRHDYLPFGEELTGAIGGRSTVYGYPTSSSTAVDGVTHADGVTQEFTGKERDAETGLDYFGARYLSSAQGRWMSPDWSATPQAVPYADLSDPQTLNLYAYVRNNPLSKADADGHCVVDGETHGAIWCGAHKIGLVSTKKEDEAAQKEEKAQQAAQEAERRHAGPPTRLQKMLTQLDLGMQFSMVGAFEIVEEGAQVAGVAKTAIEEHHLLPKQFADLFKRAGLDIEEFTMDLERGAHRLKPEGLHAQGPNGWNQEWAKFFKATPNATKQEILNQLDKMKVMFGIK